MKILIIAMTDSIHTSRWVSQIIDQGWDVHIFPSILGGIAHDKLRGVKIHDSFLSFNGKVGIKFSSLPSLFAAIPDLIMTRFNTKRFHQRRLSKLIDRLKPDIVHTLEFQTSAYLMLEAKMNLKEVSFKWIATNWGSDIYYFGRFPEHEKKIREVLSQCDYYSCECERDVALARQFGFKGETLPVFPNAGGFDLSEISSLRQDNAEDRKIIMLKGYQGWSGRALSGLDALKKCKDLLSGYEIVLYSVDPNSEVPNAVDTFRQETGISVKILPAKTPHDAILKFHGQARISIGLSISDAISTSLLEALVMGSFPIQSSTACTDEWINDGKTGIKVPPEDPVKIAEAVKKALLDDDLINSARKHNYKLTEERLDSTIIKNKSIDFYKSVYSDKKESAKVTLLDKTGKKG